MYNSLGQMMSLVERVEWLSFWKHTFVSYLSGDTSWLYAAAADIPALDTVAGACASYAGCVSDCASFSYFEAIFGASGGGNFCGLNGAFCVQTFCLDASLC